MNAHENDIAGQHAQPLPIRAPYLLNIEGRGEMPWHLEVITVEEIIGLGGWQETVTVIEVDHENNERTLVAGEVVRLKEKHSFGKKHHWKRG
jgi:hypothetical protein